jgi:deoxyuridine 5'-triphosphate nucleotidohydrolase
LLYRKELVCLIEPNLAPVSRRIRLKSANDSVMDTDGRIAPRSGLASKHFIDTGAGVIDADYRGQVKVLLFNHSEKDYTIKEGDRIAQLVLERVRVPVLVFTT